MEKEKELNLNALDAVAGGTIQQNEYGFQVVDLNGNVIGYYHTLEEAEFYASHICPRCRKSFQNEADIANHIKSWESGQQ